MQLEEVLQVIRDAGFTPRGGFAPQSGDAVPDFDWGRPARTLLLVGNAGPAMWDRFIKERNPETDRLDDWSHEKLTEVAQRLDAKALFPFTKPSLPFQRWAQKAQACHYSPVGIAIHPDYGLWHAYRGALTFATTIDLPPPDMRPSPCDSCCDRPCLNSCPVGAFTSATYDVAACARHLAEPIGSTCMSGGCLARRACPQGREYAYSPDQAAFFMRAYLRGRREDKTI